MTTVIMITIAANCTSLQLTLSSNTSIGRPETIKDDAFASKASGWQIAVSPSSYIVDIGGVAN